MKSNLLIVDDERAALESYQELFKDHFRVLLAESVARSMQILRRFEIKVLVTDMRMPGQDGAVLLEMANRDFRRPVKIMLSAYVDQFFDDAFQTKFRPFAVLRKPLTKPEA